MVEGESQGDPEKGSFALAEPVFKGVPPPPSARERRSEALPENSGRAFRLRQRDPLRISFMRVPSELDGRGCAATVTM